MRTVHIRKLIQHPSKIFQLNFMNCALCCNFTFVIKGAGNNHLCLKRALKIKADILVYCDYALTAA